MYLGTQAMAQSRSMPSWCDVRTRWARHKLRTTEEATRPLASPGPPGTRQLTDEEIKYMCEWAPEMGDDLEIDEYGFRPVGNDELENYLDDGYEVILPADAGYDGGMKTIAMMH